MKVDEFWFYSFHESSFCNQIFVELIYYAAEIL